MTDDIARLNKWHETIKAAKSAAKLADSAYNRGDFDLAAGFYADAAVLYIQEHEYETAGHMEELAESMRRLNDGVMDA